MHKLIADPQIVQVRKRASEGDCPITPSLSVESLEDLVLHLADAKKEDQSAKINRDAFAAVQVVVRAAWRLVDNTANGGTEHQAVPSEDWLELAHAAEKALTDALSRLSALQERAERAEKALADERVVSARLTAWTDGYGGVDLTLAGGRRIALALGPPHEASAPGKSA